MFPALDGGDESTLNWLYISQILTIKAPTHIIERSPALLLNFAGLASVVTVVKELGEQKGYSEWFLSSKFFFVPNSLFQIFFFFAKT